MRDAAGRPLSGAAVVVGDGALRLAAVTGSSGTYRFDGLQTGAISVHVFSPGTVYDPGHGLQPLHEGDNAFDARLPAQPANAGPRFTGPPSATLSGTDVTLRVPIVAGPGSPVGSELLAVDPAVGVAVLLERSGAGVASATVPLSAARDGLDWSFVGTDDACQTTPTFPTAHLAA